MPLITPTRRGCGGRACLFLFAVPWTAFAVFWVVMAAATGPWWFALFGVPFVLVGLALLIASMLPAIVGMKVGRSSASLSRDPARIGETVQFAYVLPFRRSAVVDRVEMRFVFRETAAYQRGTDTVTENHDLELDSHRDQPGALRAGQAYRLEKTLLVPPDGMHSFAAPNNKLRYLVLIHAALAGWPDLNEEFEVRVLPEEAS